MIKKKKMFKYNSENKSNKELKKKKKKNRVEEWVSEIERCYIKYKKRTSLFLKGKIKYNNNAAAPCSCSPFFSIRSRLVVSLGCGLFSYSL